MKKLIYGAAVALLIGAASCGKSDGSADGGKFFSASATDSLLTSFGELVGSSMNERVAQQMVHDSTFSKEVFIKALQAAMAADSSDAYMNGYITGLQVQQQLKSFHRMGIDVDPAVVLKAIKKNFLTDSLPSSIEMQMLNGTFRMWTDSLDRAQRTYAIDLKKSSEEAIANAAKGKDFIAAKVASDSLQTTPSGMAYKVISAGDAEKLTPDSRPILKVVARTADGRVFEQYDKRQTRLAGVVPGLQEGLLLLGKGGHAVFYIPGELAYGVEAPDRLGLGMNEAVVYDVEVVDVASASVAPQSMPQGMTRR